MPGGATPDPVSVAWERDAARFLARVYQGKGEWVTHLVYDPSPRHVEAWARQGINVNGRDPVKLRKAKTRWLRAYVRACYRLNKKGRRRAIEFEVGRRRPPSGRLGWRTPIRMRVKAGGQAADRAVRRKPLAQRIYAEDGSPGALWADPADRDW